MQTVPLRYSVRNLLVRKVTSAMTVLGIALVVATFVALMAMAQGLDRTLSMAGRPDGAVVLRKGAMAEVASSLTIDQFMVLRDFARIARDRTAGTLASPELVLQVLLGQGTGEEVAVALRGVRPVALSVHDQVRVVKGRAMAVRSGELLVGQAIQKRRRDLGLGASVRLFDRSWKVVGVIASGGGSLESEIWCDLDDLMSDARRPYFSTVFVRLGSAGDQAGFREQVDLDPRLGLDARTEIDYYAEQLDPARRMRWMGLAVASIMAFGAIFAAMNTMYAAVSARTRDFAILRATGFSRWAVVTSVVSESALLGLAGGVVGCLLSIPLNGMSAGMINTRFTSDIAFSLELSPAILGAGLLFSLAMGLLGGLLPAWVSVSTPIVRALREA